MSPASEVLCAFVFEKSSDEPVSRRIQLYRALAATLLESDPRFTELTKLADSLDEIERRCRQLRLDLDEDDSGDGDGGARG